MRRAYRLPVRSLGEPYFISWNFDAEIPKSSNGIINNGTNPVTAAQYALTLHQRDAREPFLAHATFIRDNMEADGKFPYHFRHESYGLGVTWYSAMPQGEAASVLLRAYALTGDLTYVEAAKRSLEPLQRDVRDGGVSYLRGSDVFFEEAASAERPVHVLNGHLFAAFGLWEVLEHGFGNAALRELHAGAVETLRRWLPKYDLDGWSRYALAVDENSVPHIATLMYHQFHIAQLTVYAAMTGEAVFASYAARWRHNLDDAGIRLRYVAHSFRRMAYGIRRAALRSRREWYPLA